MRWYFQLVLAISFGQYFITIECRDVVVLSFNDYRQASGIVRVRVNRSIDFWKKSICLDDSWGMANANVTCRQMGYLKATSYEWKTDAALSSVIYNVRCTGNETNIADCSYSHSGTCTGGKQVFVTCSKNPAFDGVLDVRLNKGVVEERAAYIFGVNNNPAWFTQCYNLWSPINSKVVCKQLGYSGAKTTRGIIGNHPNVAGGEIRCTGTEQTLRNCPVISTSDCIDKMVHSKVECVLGSETQQRFDVRLSMGNESAGTVELLRYGQWGLICDHVWQVNDARVVCQQLGFIDAIRETKEAEFGQGNGPIYLSYPNCKGNEWSLATCRKVFGWGGKITMCRSWNTAGVVCNPTKFPSYDTSTSISTTNAAESTGRFFLRSPGFPKLFNYDASSHLVCVLATSTITELSFYIHYKMFKENHQETLSFQAGETQVSSRYFYSLKLYGDNSNHGPYTTKTQNLLMNFQSNGAKGMGKFRVEIRVPNDTAVTLRCFMVATQGSLTTTTTTTTLTTTAATTDVTTQGAREPSPSSLDCKIEGGLIGAAIMTMVLVVVVILEVLLWKLGILKFSKYRSHQPGVEADAYDDTRLEFTDIANPSSPTYVNQSDSNVDQSVQERPGAEQLVQENEPESAYQEIGDYGRGVSGQMPASNPQATSDYECPYDEVYSKNSQVQHAGYVDMRRPGTEPTGRGTTEGAVAFVGSGGAEHQYLMLIGSTEGAVGLERSSAQGLRGDPQAVNDSVGHTCPESAYTQLDEIDRPVYMHLK